MLTLKIQRHAARQHIWQQDGVKPTNSRSETAVLPTYRSDHRYYKLKASTP